MITGLDGLRAIACLMVLLFHTGNSDFGWAGVQLFFVLSGFLITGILLRMKATLPAKQYFSSFYGRRFLRIFPLYFFYLFLLTIAIWQGNSNSSGVFKGEIQEIVRPQISYAYFYLYDFFRASDLYQSTRFLSHLWSLSVEEQFYIFWPLVLFFTPREKMKTLFLSMIACAPILRLLLYLAYSRHFLTPPMDAPYSAVYFLPFSHIDAFAIGAYISCYQLPKVHKQLALLVSAVPLLGFVTQFIATGRIQLDTLGYEFTLFSAYKVVWGYSLLNYFFAVLIDSVAHTKLFTNFLDHSIFRYLGRISYGLYVYHLPVIWFVLAFQLNYKLPFPFYIGQMRTFFLVLLITVIVASISFYLFEKPINDLKDQFFPLLRSRKLVTTIPSEEPQIALKGVSP
jgi:peptidoglycan/LPS O-acetylase OafA/YrhL